MYDTIVVGAGVVGSATAYHLAKDGQKVLLLEQFPLPHGRGSSHGHSRIIRKAYPSQHWYYSKMVTEAVGMWRELEQESGLHIYRDVGVLSVGFDQKIMDSVSSAMKKTDVVFDSLDHARLKREYPMIVNTPSGTSAFVEKEEGGLIYADKALQAFQKVFQQNGGVILDHTKVESILPGDVVTVKTVKGDFVGKKLVITVGPWASSILGPLGLKLPIQSTVVTVMYWKEKTPGLYSAERFPCLRFVNVIDGKHNLYGLPADEYPGMFKLCLHDGHPCDPESRDHVSVESDIKEVSKFITKHLPDLQNKPAIVEKCFYTITPDIDYVLDVHPRWSNIVVGAGFSGHGFKLAPVSGKILANLAGNKSNVNYEMDQFSIKRFYRSSKL